MRCSISVMSVALCAAVACPTTSHALQKRKKEEPPPRIEVFRGELADARTRARDRNVPLVVFVIQEGEEANERFRDDIYVNKDVIVAVQHVVVVLANDGKHEMKKIVEERGEEKVEREVCARFETPTCNEHRRHFDTCFAEFNVEGLMQTPQTIVVLPDGVEHGRIVDVPAPSQVVAVVQEASRKAGPGLSEEQYLEVRKLLDEGQRAHTRGKWEVSLRCWDAILAIGDAGPWADEARKTRAEALKLMQEEIDRALALLESGSVAAGYERLLELRALYEDTPVSKDLERTIRAAERNPDWADEIKAYKREVEARELLAEIEKMLAAGDETKAKGRMRKLLRSYADTEAATIAKGRWPDLVDVDAPAR